MGIHHDWGLRPYGELHAYQQQLVEARVAGQIPNVLLTGEHDPVITLGRRTPEDGCYTLDIPRFHVERGGEATYHGPGQLVAYPIVHLTQARRDLHRFQRDLEEVGIRTLADFGIEAGRSEGFAGVWVGTKKIQSLGVAVRRWVTWHGLALNVSTGLEAFGSFNPCGLDGSVMTSMEALLGRAVAMADVRDVLVQHAGDVLPGGPFLDGALPASEALPAAGKPPPSA